MILERKVSPVDQTHLRVLDHRLELLSSRRQEAGIVLAPDGQERWLIVGEVLLECWIERDVRLLVVKEVELDVDDSRSSEKSVIKPVCLRRYGFGVCLPSEVLV